MSEKYLVFSDNRHLGIFFNIFIEYRMFRSFCLTIRPRDGISEATIEATKKWLTKCNYAVAVLEKTSHERHLHAQVWFETAKARGDICKQVQRICERTVQEWDTAQLKVLRSGVKIAYSDWYLDYLVDNEDKEPPNIVLNNPPNMTMEYYPTEEEQEEVKTMKTATDPRMAELEIKCLKHLGDKDVTEKSVARFLAYAMFEERSIKCILQQRDRTALCRTLFAYMTKSSDIYLFLVKTEEEKKWDKMVNKLGLLEENNLSVYYKDGLCQTPPMEDPESPAYDLPA